MQKSAHKTGLLGADTHTSGFRNHPCVEQLESDLEAANAEVEEAKTACGRMEKELASLNAKIETSQVGQHDEMTATIDTRVADPVRTLGKAQES